MILSRRIRAQNKRNRTKFLRNLDVESLMRSLEIRFSRMGPELYCPCVHPDHKDRKPSWHIHSQIGYEKNSVFFCWSCHWTGNAITLVKVLKGLSTNDSISYLQPFLREKIQYESSVDPMAGLHPYTPSELNYEWRGIHFQPLLISDSSESFRYLVNRGIGRRDIEYFGIRDWVETNRIVVPITRKRQLISWIARTYRNENPKVWAPVGAPKRWEIFGLDFVSDWDEANISEGWADAIRLHQAGLKNPLALCGSRMSEQQAEEISRFGTIRIWTDGDLAGRGMAQDIATWLPGKNIEVVECPEGQDPGSLEIEDVLALKPKTYREWRRGK